MVVFMRQGTISLSLTGSTFLLLRRESNCLDLDAPWGWNCLAFSLLRVSSMRNRNASMVCRSWSFKKALKVYLSVDLGPSLKASRQLSALEKLEQRKGRPFQADLITIIFTTVISMPTTIEDSLRGELLAERTRFQQIEQKMIRDQQAVLEQLTQLQQRFTQLRTEKQSLERNISEHKIGEALVNLMRKVSGSQGGVEEAWRWIKKVVGEYGLIRKKALKWKRVYDDVTEHASELGLEV